MDCFFDKAYMTEAGFARGGDTMVPDALCRKRRAVPLLYICNKHDILMVLFNLKNCLFTIFPAFIDHPMCGFLQLITIYCSNFVSSHLYIFFCINPLKDRLAMWLICALLKMVWGGGKGDGYLPHQYPT